MGSRLACRTATLLGINPHSGNEASAARSEVDAVRRMHASVSALASARKIPPSPDANIEQTKWSGRTKAAGAAARPSLPADRPGSRQADEDPAAATDCKWPSVS